MSGSAAFDSVLSLRDRLVSSARFRKFAAAFPLTRPIARRRTRALFDLCAGFVYSQVLSACLDLEIFEILAARPRDAGELAQMLALSLDRTERLLAAAVSLRLLDRRGRGRFGLGALGAALVGNEAVASMVAHHAVLYRDLADPVALLRGTAAPALGGYWAYETDGSAEQVQAYTALMAASQPLVADEILDAYPVRKHRCLLDVGGGDGRFLVAAASRAPDLRLVLFDLPAVAAHARERFAAAALSNRALAVGGSFLTDSLPQGADIVSLVRVIHDHDDAQAMTVLRAVRRALPKDGVLLLAEPMSETPGAEPIGDAYFGFYLLAMGRGRPRTPARLGAMLAEAGFAKMRHVKTHTPLLASLIVARRD